MITSMFQLRNPIVFFTSNKYSYQNIFSPDVVNTWVYAVDNLTGFLIDNFDIARIIWMDLFIDDCKGTLRQPIFQHIVFPEKRSKLSRKALS